MWLWLVVCVAGVSHDHLRGQSHPPHAVPAAHGHLHLLNEPPRVFDEPAPWETEPEPWKASPKPAPAPQPKPQELKPQVPPQAQAQAPPQAPPQVEPVPKIRYQPQSAPPVPPPAPPSSDPLEELERALPVPDAVRAVSVLCCAYFAVHFLLAVGTGLDCYGRDVADCMEDLRAVVAEAPMLGVLFLAMRLQSVRVHGMDAPGFARVAMEVASGCLLLRIVATVVHYADEPEASRVVQVWVTCLGFLCVVTALIGTAAVHGLTLPCSVATAALGAVYITFGALLEASRFNTNDSPYTKVLHLAQHTLSPAPMLAVGYLALELQREARSPPTPLAEACTFISTAGLLTAAALVLIAQLADEKHAPQPGERPTNAVAMENKAAALCIKFSIPACMAIMFAAYAVLAHQVLSGPLGPQGISAALSCLILLTLLFFGVYGALFLRALTADGDAWNAGLIAARRGVAPAPMVGVVIVAARMRALSLNPKGGPPGWCMDAMYVATLGVFLSLCAAAARTTKATSDAATYTRHSLTLVAAVCLYGGVLTILGSMFTMQPHTATGTGSLVHAVIYPSYR